ncbi:nitroreductase family protein, partial [Enterocloster citroniae]|uniref:nitroreductase family protein n=1 Tax=Enterocloster citroniae TaxID=358743 RepID=UPI00349EB2DB
KDAPLLIVTAFVKNHSGHDNQGNPVNEVGNGWGCYDLGLHDSHLILKAKDLGLDTLIMGIRDADALRELLDIGQDQEVVSVIAVGYRDIDPAGPGRKGLDETARFY